jgi:hypothetical protein
MVAISPALALSKAKIFLALILALFCTMHVHVTLAAGLDRRRRDATRTMLFSKEFGFVANKNGVWTWGLFATTDPDTGVVLGPAVRFAAAVGLPLARLQFALPEEVMNFETAASPHSSSNTASSTALVFAFIKVRLLADSEELVTRQMEAAEHFSSMWSGEITFDALVETFTEMLANETLSRPSMWLACARLWRIVLLQRKGGAWQGIGGWDPTPGLAFALYATRDDALESTEMHPSDFGTDMIIGSCPAYLRAAFTRATPCAVNRMWTTLLVCAVLSRLSVCRISNMGVHGSAHDQLTLLDEAEEWLLQAAMSHFGASSSLQHNLLHHAAEELLAAAHRDAEETLRYWRRTHNARVARIRAVSNANRGSTGGNASVFSTNRLHRVTGSIYVALHRCHEAAGTLAAPHNDGLTRAQRAALLITTLLGLLCVDTWFFWARGVACCGQIREFLDCPASPAPCLGYSGDCADLQAQFADFYTGGVQCPAPGSSRLGDWTCSAFPDPDSNRDNLVVGLIAALVTLPLRQVLAVLLKLSNEVESEPTWLFLHPIAHSIMRGLRLNVFSWRWRTALPSWPVRYALRHEMEPFKFALEALCDAVAHLFPALTRRDGSAGVSPAHHREVEEALLHAARRRVARVLGILLIYVTWSLFVWFIVAYGIETFGLMGSVSENEFVRNWAITVGIEQATQMGAVASTFSSGIALQLADIFWIMP